VDPKKERLLWSAPETRRFFFNGTALLLVGGLTILKNGV
jgi:hypothetical protein